jgi:hypothetical protein
MRAPSAITLDVPRGDAPGRCPVHLAASTSPTGPVTNAGVVHEDVEMAEMIDNLMHQLRHRPVGLVCLEGAARTPAPELTNQGFRLPAGYIAEATSAPSSARARAMAAPMPREPPVTSATFPASFRFMTISWRLVEVLERTMENSRP